MRLLSSLDLLVHASAAEVWSYLLLESVYAGPPVVISDAVAWAVDLDPAVRELCVVRPPAASAQLQQLAGRLLDDPDARAAVLAAQRALLDRRAAGHAMAAALAFRAVGIDAMIPHG